MRSVTVAILNTWLVSGVHPEIEARCAKGWAEEKAADLHRDCGGAINGLRANEVHLGHVR